MDLIAVLQKMGAIISVQTDRTIRIEGVPDLGGYNHRALSDRNESASWASAALVTRGDIFVEGATQRDMMTFLNTYRKVGGGMDIGDDGIRFYHKGGKLNPLVLETDVHPGFMTDWQQPLIVALTQAEGVSIVHETVYENRFGFTDPQGGEQGVGASSPTVSSRLHHSRWATHTGTTSPTSPKNGPIGKR